MLTLDASTPALAGAINKPWVTSSFTPPVGSKLLVVAMCIGTGSAAPTLTVTSTSLTFASEVAYGGIVNGFQAYVQIYSCDVGANGGSSRTVSVTTNQSGSLDSGSVKAYVLTGDVASVVDTGVGGTDGVTNVPSGPPVEPAGMPIVAVDTVHGAWTFGGFSDWAGLSTCESGTDVYEFYHDVNGTHMCIRRNAPQSGDGESVVSAYASGNFPQWTWAFTAVGDSVPPARPEANVAGDPTAVNSAGG